MKKTPMGEQGSGLDLLFFKQSVFFSLLLIHSIYNCDCLLAKFIFSFDRVL